MKLNIEREIYIVDCDTEDVFELVEILDYDYLNKILTALFRCKDIKIEERYLEEYDVSVSNCNADITLKAEIDFEDIPQLVDYSVYKLNVDVFDNDSEAVINELTYELEEDYASLGCVVLEVGFKDRLCI